ncbi:MAG TPA: DUF1998 domain-containing protein [Nitrospirae bacterium]|nr:hypothetical protein BMS3Abin06_02345 [bacterium BMS3Abin06]HDH12139.1 DUF1998 domain-containing protein [Nitrospirota bacterium]HDZ02355.1 DUF1998 domain-containing protein [Nitrospirota bacterium]
MIVVRDGTSLISGGLDNWFKRESGEDDGSTLDRQEFAFEEWRLQRLLRVSEFRLPPDFRTKRLGGNVTNTNLTIPFLRFPQWHFCRICSKLHRLPLTARGRIKCDECLSKGKINYLIQVPFVAMCDYGHIQDFPWKEWTHRSDKTGCTGTMRLISTGGASLSAQVVKCDCGKERNLARITEAAPDQQETYLSRNLDSTGTYFLCQGHKPWLGFEEGEPCNRHLRGTLRSASNVYFADVKSAIYIPRGNSSAPSELITLMEQPPLSTFLNLLSGTGIEIKPDHLRGQHTQILQPFSDAEISAAISILLSGKKDSDQDAEESGSQEDREVSIRREEFNVLRSKRGDAELLIRDADITQYKQDVSRHFSKVMLVEKLRETRVLSGFTRVLPENNLTLEQKKALLWRNSPEGNSTWLPAYKVYGEGIFIELDENKLRSWEMKDEVNQRINGLVERYQQRQRERGLRVRLISPRFVLLHTLSHILINQLTFECGYSSAALRERLYVSNNREAPMAGILIYTAAGDSEGTMGGLVRMGKKGYFEPVIKKALDKATWCSTDPVCMEIGEFGGQGPDNCNLAACHNCALVPETACEEFNRFLDRALLVGDIKNPNIGYFKVGRNS